MIIVNNWQDSELIDRDVKSCDNKDIGDLKQIDQSYLTVQKGEGSIRVPRSAIGTFNDGKIYLRATEAEVLSGVYPFLESETPNYQYQNQTYEQKTPKVPMVPQDT
jgi:hypothetical protein